MYGNVYDYISWRGDLDFTRDPVNEIDGLIFSIIAYVDFSGVSNADTFNTGEALTLRKAVEQASFGSRARDEKSEKFFAEKLQFSIEASKCERFGGLKLFAFEDKFDKEREMQFSALSVLLPGDTLVIAFRGTDDTLIGWKEDFSMSFMQAVPAQLYATDYAKKVIDIVSPRKIYFAGHSKGGNLAVWAAASLSEEIQNKIAAVYNNDGPGFSADFTVSRGFLSIENKIHKFVPESSVVGMLLEQEENYKTIGSSKKIFLQHNPLSWYIEGKEFVILEERSSFGKHSDVITREWLSTLSKEEREEFLDSVFEIVGAGNARTIGDITDSGFSGALEIVKTYYDSDPGKKKIISGIVKKLTKKIKEEIL